jgi:hypothetical protein
MPPDRHGSFSATFQRSRCFPNKAIFPIHQADSCCKARRSAVSDKLVSFLKKFIKLNKEYGKEVVLGK